MRYLICIPLFFWNTWFAFLGQCWLALVKHSSMIVEYGSNLGILLHAWIKSKESDSIHMFVLPSCSRNSTPRRRARALVVVALRILSRTHAMPAIASPLWFRRSAPLVWSQCWFCPCNFFLFRLGLHHIKICCKCLDYEGYTEMPHFLL
jgi:hypothetical protein